MSFSDILPFFLTAAAIGFIYVKRSRAKERRYEAHEIIPVVTRDVFMEETPAELRERLTSVLADQGISVHSEEGSRIVFDSPTIGAFHWGFLYTLDMAEKEGGTMITFGIFGKGPNPPRRKTLEGFLNEFVNGRILS